MAHAATSESRQQFQQLQVRYQPGTASLWYYMKSRPRPCFTITLLGEIAQFQQQVRQRDGAAEDGRQVDFLVLTSAIPGIFNLGGDLELFKQLIRNNDRDGLVHYAYLCINVLYQNVINLDLPLTTIAMVKGSALGGGLEAALSCDVIVAEKGVKLGFPEILFNLFPGMGAYSLLARRLDPVRAEKLMLSGKLYDAEELYEMGLVDHLAEPGKGEEVAEEYMRRHNKYRNGYRGILRAREKYYPIGYTELKEITDIWVETALTLTEKDIRMMDRLVRSQERLYHNFAETVRTHGAGKSEPELAESESVPSISNFFRIREPYLHSVTVKPEQDVRNEDGPDEQIV